MLISLCQFILEGMLLTTDSGEYKLASFVDEQRMNRLYEKFILEYYAKECPQVTATASQLPRGQKFVRVNQFRFQTAEPSFDHNVVRPAGLSIHALTDVEFFQ